MSTTLDTLQLDGWHLDYFTGLALGYEMLVSVEMAYLLKGMLPFDPLSSGDDMRLVLLRMRTVMKGADGKADWMARAEGCDEFARGPSPEIAMCRALVLGKFGKTVCLPVADSCEDLF